MKVPFKRALVTGATGFVGAQLVQTLRKRGLSVTSFALPEEDITNSESVKHVVQRVEPEVIFHLAAYGTFGQEKDVERMIAVNIGGTRNLLAAAVEVGCQAFVQAGSAKEYAPTRVPITEEQRLAPWDDYAVTKAAAAYFCRLAAARAPFKATTLRLSPVYGPGDSPTRFVLTAIAAALSGKPFTITVGSLVRNFTYIDDVVEAFLAASVRSEEKYEEFNVASAEAHSFEEGLAAVEKATGKKILRVVAPYSGSGDDSWVLDSSKAERLLKWQPRVSLEEGMRRTVEWYRKERVLRPG